jgi:hypothetical protein
LFGVVIFVFSVGKSGDCSVIMPTYEAAIATPIKSALTGEEKKTNIVFAFDCLFEGPLVQLLLIQVQKARADTTLALSAVDKLVAANEINFQIIAATPMLLGCVTLLFCFVFHFVQCVRACFVWCWFGDGSQSSLAHPALAATAAGPNTAVARASGGCTATHPADGEDAPARGKVEKQKEESCSSVV